MNELFEELQDKIFVAGVENKTLIQKDFEDLMDVWKRIKEEQEEEELYKITKRDIVSHMYNYVLRELGEFYGRYNKYCEFDELQKEYKVDIWEDEIRGEIQTIGESVWERDENFAEYLLNKIQSEEVYEENKQELFDKHFSQTTIIEIMRVLQLENDDIARDTTEEVIVSYFECFTIDWRDDIIKFVYELDEYKNFVRGTKECGCEECKNSGVEEPVLCRECSRLQSHQEDRQEDTTDSEENN